MARIDNLGNFLTDVANAIRNKTGGTASLKPANFDTEISNIKSGNSYPPIIFNATGSYLGNFAEYGAYFNNMGDLVIYVIPSSTSYENVKFVAGTQFIGVKWFGWDQTSFSNSCPGYIPHCCFIRGVVNCKCLSVTINTTAQDATNDYTTVTVSVSELAQDPGTRALIYTQTNSAGDLIVKISGESSNRTMKTHTLIQVPLGATVTVKQGGLPPDVVGAIHTYLYNWFKPDFLQRTQITEGADFLGTYTWQFVMPDTDVSVHAWTMGCFVAGTKVLMADNSYKNIEDITVGDKVACYNEEEQKNDISEVTQTFINAHTSFVTLTLDNGESFTCTLEHNIYSVDRNCYVPANELSIGEVLQTHTGACAIKDVNIVENTELTTVYNFTVKDKHNYFVGRGSYRVHNAVS